MIRCVLGYDDREAVAIHTCASSILRRASRPVSFLFLHPGQLITDYAETHTAGSGLIKEGYGASNAFSFSRFLVPWLMGFEGWAAFLDGDMIVKRDIVDLWRLRDPSKAVQVVPHDYVTRHPVKYLGQKNEDYPRKNWSSVILWNCAHPRNRLLTPDFVMGQSGAYLHRFEWLEDVLIGALPRTWNWLVEEFQHNDEAHLLHYTVGAPCFAEYHDCDHAEDWFAEHRAMTRCDQLEDA